MRTKILGAVAAALVLTGVGVSAVGAQGPPDTVTYVCSAEDVAVEITIPTRAAEGFQHAIDALEEHNPFGVTCALD